MKKSTIYKLGLLTLLVFPIPTFLVLYYVEGIRPIDVLDLESCTLSAILSGLALGMVYALLAMQIIKLPVFEKLPNRIEKMVQEMDLSLWDCFFLSVCAGVGEELLFRSGMQFYLGPIFTSIFFVAIHGYLDPRNWRMSLYGLIVLPFILIISFALEPIGLWFAIAAHFSYDFVLFRLMTQNHS